MANQYKHLLVDLDGTLLGSRNFRLQIDFISQALKEFRQYADLKQSLKALFAMRRGLAKSPLVLDPFLTNDKRAAMIFSKEMGVSLEKAEEILKTSMTGLFPSLKRHFFPIKEAVEFLDWARGRYSLTLATDPVWPVELIKLRLEWAGINPKYFQTITHAQMMHACKPTAEYYKELLRFEEFDPEDCLLIGNDVSMDLPATQVGIPVYIVSRGEKTRKLQLPKGLPSAWRGSFPGLKKLLSQPEIKS